MRGKSVCDSGDSQIIPRWLPDLSQFIQRSPAAQVCMLGAGGGVITLLQLTSCQSCTSLQERTPVCGFIITMQTCWTSFLRPYQLRCYVFPCKCFDWRTCVCVCACVFLLRVGVIVQHRLLSWLPRYDNHLHTCSADVISAAVGAQRPPLHPSAAWLGGKLRWDAADTMG